MKVKIVSGFLGSGKTTLVKHLLEHSGPGTAVLVNEFGDVGIDGELFQGENVDIVELPSGCICCALKNDLILSINELYEKVDPKILIIEPSGVATLSDVMESLTIELIKAPIELEAIITVIEPDLLLEDQEFENLGRFYYDQIGNADLILINKCDINPPEDIEKAAGILQKINPTATIMPAVYCEVTLPVLVSSGEVKMKDEHHHHHEGEHSLKSLAYRRNGNFDPEKVKEFLAQLVKGDFGRVYRAKGFFQGVEGSYHFELVRDKWEISSWEKPLNESKFVIIGESLPDLGSQVDLTAV
ncbi:CobW family GTP-binding protein [Candidatus Contubernalis alkaliaceticus]|uniref:CobW family GTP-binding protein n=1 Tax=Candidatus Contubernalis alkaliaceticus TaxID=338645 RepID=UPI001F4C5259|nr:GTP-binding protein [Candidatus Contubernalis alkalaceticus]UNC91569.1 GTP-binding protein [Candidatus Contubernalis alkalaceticus]